MAGPYERARFSRPDNEIRLLQTRRSATEEIECWFEVYPVDECPDYTALSYTWSTGGSDENECNYENLPGIRLDGTSAPVGRNLYEFLERVSREHPGCRHWIDALCINQKDDTEKGSQIPLMKEIYTNASKVIVWLGQLWIPEETREFIKSKGSPTSQLDNLSIIYDGLVSLCWNRYWSRLWIVQEVVFARKLCIHYQDSSIEWNEFAWIFDRLGAQTHTHFLSIIQSPAGNVFLAKNVRKENLPLHKLIHTYRHLQCSRQHPQDTIYGLMGLASRESTVPVDYGKSRMGVLEEVMVKACQTGSFPDWRSAVRAIKKVLNLYDGYYQYEPRERIVSILDRAGWTEARASYDRTYYPRHSCIHGVQCGARPFENEADLGRHVENCHPEALQKFLEQWTGQWPYKKDRDTT